MLVLPMPYGYASTVTREPAARASVERREHAIDVALRRAVDVAVVHRGAGLGGRDRDLEGAVDRSGRVDLDEFADMREGRARRRLRASRATARYSAGSERGA